jgi:formate dehydrogenase iron-sulfur subunit
MTHGMLFDSTLCVGCGACSAACKEQNGLPPSIEERTTAYTWTTVERWAGVNVRRLCMHCLTPTCASVCPVGAMTKTAAGPVVYDSALCIGCRYCIVACPFDVPKYQWDQPVPVVGKCVMCAPRLAAGQSTACATVCPTGATLFGERDALVREARARIAREPSRYVDRVYGLDEAGGTSVLLLAGVPFGQLGLPAHLPHEPLPMLTWRVLSQLPDVVMVSTVFLFGVHWITRRRREVRASEAGDAPVEPPTGARWDERPGP